MANTKRGLGKNVECRTCRNQRIASEILEIRRHFCGEDEESGL